MSILGSLPDERVLLDKLTVGTKPHTPLAHRSCWLWPQEAWSLGLGMDEWAAGVGGRVGWEEGKGARPWGKHWRRWCWLVWGEWPA